MPSIFLPKSGQTTSNHSKSEAQKAARELYQYRLEGITESKFLKGFELSRGPSAGFDRAKSRVWRSAQSPVFSKRDGSFRRARKLASGMCKSACLKKVLTKKQTAQCFYAIDTRTEEPALPSYSGRLLLSFALLLPQITFAGDKEAGEALYYDGCVSCHGQAGKGASSYPKVSGNDVAYTIEKLELYRAGVKQGSNSALMFMMAKPLTDEEIANLAAYLEDAVYVVQ